MRVGGRRVAIVHCVSGWYALEDECSHQGGPLGEGDLVDEGVVRCPWHGARFDVRTGEVLDGPAARPARTYPVTADDGLVTVAVDNAVEAAAAAATDSRRRGGPGWRRSRPPPDPDPKTTNPTIEPGSPAAGGPVSTARAGAGGRGRARGRGQWAYGYHEPLNDSERIKRDQDGLEVYERTVTIHAAAGRRLDLGCRSRDPLPLVRPVHAATRRGWVLHDAGAGAQRVAHRGASGGVGRISQRFGRDVCDVTDRQNFQFHWIRIEDVPEIWARLGAVGLTSRQTCGDVTRNIIGCPLADVAGDDILHAHPYAIAVDRRLSGTKEFSNLPRKYKISISGCREQCAVHEVMDIGLVGVEHANGRRGFDLRVGGGERAVDVCAGITGLFRDYGYRRDHHRARLKFPTGERRGSAKCSNMSICRVR